MNFLCIFSVINVAAIFCCVAYILGNRTNVLPTVRKILASLLALTALVCSVFHNEAISIVRGLNFGPSPFGDDMLHTALATILLWFVYSAILITVVGEFSGFTTLRYLQRCFALPVFVIALIFFTTLTFSVIGATNEPLIFLIFICIELMLGLALSTTSWLCDKLPSPRAKDVFATFGAAIPAIVAAMPFFAPQVIIGFSPLKNISLTEFSLAHRIAIYASVIIPFVIFHLLKNKDTETKRICMIYLSVGLLWAYLSYYQLSDWTSTAGLPLDICSIVVILLPISLIFKRSEIFYCCLFIGSLTALVDILLPVSDFASMISSESIRFWVSRCFVFAVPILCTALKIFKRPTAKDLARALGVFLIYFATALALGALFENYGENPDYLNLNGNYLLPLLGDLVATIKKVALKIPLGNITLAFYPIFELVVCLSHLILMIVVWFAYKFLFATWDKAEDRRLRERDYKQMKKELKEFLGQRSADAPIYGDDSPRLALRNFSKKYGNNKHYSVDHVSFCVKGGEIFGFLGPNGAGKSTIIKSVVGIQTISSGSIEICGYDVERQPIQAKLNTGFVPDHYALYENLTGREYINYIADLYGVDKESRDETIERYVSRFQLTASFDNQMKTYSHGMKQKIAIMAALIHNPKVWILDEPLTGLDPNSIFEVKECMKEHAAKGNIVFFSSHIIDVVEKICDKIAIIKKGKLRAVANVAELDARGIDLEELYLQIITADENADLINIGGDDILNVELSPDSNAEMAAVGGEGV